MPLCADISKIVLLSVYMISCPKPQDVQTVYLKASIIRVALHPVVITKN
jgi:hypothetical protein